MGIFSKPKPVLVVDVIIPDMEGKVFVLSRGHKPFKRFWCLPGGILEYGETVEHAAIREVREETQMEVMIDRVLGVFSRAGRDPRGHYISVVLVAFPTDAVPHTTDEALAFLHLQPGSKVDMAFDHASILESYWRSLQGTMKGVVG
jgi:8-oxo-dGTP diphosphatase